jgi:tetratricopeptide (TPR) repeat protein
MNQAPLPDADAYYNRGYSYAEKGEFDQAIADYTEAVMLNPVDDKAYYDRGNAWLKKGDSVRARADWEEALRINPGNADARKALDLLRP